MRVIGIFTDTTISPGSRLRQCSDRYTIRAGRNLPDKEFRYLRTVRVTAAVYGGFGSMLRLLYHVPLTFQHRAGVSTYTSDLSFADTCVFAKQSLEPILCDRCFHRHPFSRSYGVILPSSLTRVLPFVSGFSPRPPASVSGTGTKWISTSSFSRQRELTRFPTIFRSTSRLTLKECVLHYIPSLTLVQG